jgi:hypothetical protein
LPTYLPACLSAEEERKRGEEEKKKRRESEEEKKRREEERNRTNSESMYAMCMLFVYLLVGAWTILSSRFLMKLFWYFGQAGRQGRQAGRKAGRQGRQAGRKAGR